MSRTKGFEQILVVDDDADLLFSQAHLLQRAGYTVFEADCGGSGLELARDKRPDCAILDINLPDINGREVCRRIKAVPGLESTFIILISSETTSSEDQALGLETGADGYLARPLSNREFLSRVQALERLKIANDEIRYRINQQAAISRLGQFSIENRDIRQVYDFAVDELWRNLDASTVGVFEAMQDRSTFMLRCGKGWPEGMIGRSAIKFGSQLLTRFIGAPSEVVFTEDIQKDNLSIHPESFLTMGFKSSFLAPVVSNGKVQAIFAVLIKADEQFSQSDTHFVQSGANLMTAAVENRRREKDRVEQLNRDLRLLERLGSREDRDILEDHALEPLEESFPELFKEMVERYLELLQQTSRSNESYETNRSSLIAFVSQLGNLKAGPEDLADIHKSALRRYDIGPDTDGSKRVYPVGQQLFTEALGKLALYYRNFSLGMKEPLR